MMCACLAWLTDVSSGNLGWPQWQTASCGEDGLSIVGILSQCQCRGRSVQAKEQLKFTVEVGCVWGERLTQPSPQKQHHAMRFGEVQCCAAQHCRLAPTCGASLRTMRSKSSTVMSEKARPMPSESF